MMVLPLLLSFHREHVCLGVSLRLHCDNVAYKNELPSLHDLHANTLRSVCHMVCSLYKHIMRLPLLIALVLSVIAVLLCAVSLACRPDWIAWNKVEGILAVLPARYGSSL